MISIHSRAGRHFPADKEEVRVMDVDIAGLRLEYDERINRMIPTPAGYTLSPVEEGEGEDQEGRMSMLRVHWSVECLVFTLSSSRIGRIRGTETQKLRGRGWRRRPGPPCSPLLTSGSGTSSRWSSPSQSW